MLPIKHFNRVNVSIDEDELVAARQLAADLPESWLRLVNI